MSKEIVGGLTGCTAIILWLQFGLGGLLLALLGGIVGLLVARYLVPNWPAIAQWLTAGKNLFDKER